MRRLRGGKLAALGPRGRQQRLAVIETASVDDCRHLVLVRRDNVEHLLLIGGPTDVVIEPGIERAGAAATAPAPAHDTKVAATTVSARDAKASPTLEPLPRQTISLEGLGWPAGEPANVEPPPLRPARETMAREPMPQEPIPRDPMTREPMPREAMVCPPPTPLESQRLESLIEDAGAPPLLPTPPEPGPAFYPPPVPPSFEPVALADGFRGDWPVCVRGCNGHMRAKHIQSITGRCFRPICCPSFAMPSRRSFVRGRARAPRATAN
jgi:hypothetical protein